MLTELNEMMEEMNIKNAIIGEVSSSLRDILNGLTKTKLAGMAKLYKVPGRSKMKQGELAAAVYEAVNDVNHMESSLLILDPEEWAVFEKLLRDRIIQDNAVPYGYYNVLLTRGLVFSFFADGKLSLVMPDEVRETFAQADTEEFRQKRSTYALIYDYLCALTNLYGLYTLDKLLEIVNGQNPSSPLSIEDLTIIVANFLEREQKFEYYEGYIVDGGILLDSEEGEFESLLERIQDKPYYVPDKNELLKYADDGYFEMTPQLIALRSYILTHLCQDREMVDYLIDDIQLACSMEVSLQEIFYEFERRELIFESMDQVQRVSAMIVDVANNTRIWSNCGHTPMELRTSKDSASANIVQFPVRVNTKTPIRSDKIGRNEPCPCGSGLKYKKCCGK